jgi:hypothetical protein
MKIGYADPPYIGCSAAHYRDHPDYAGEVDHAQLVERLQSEFDGWVLHAGAHNASEAILAPLMAKVEARKCIWVKDFAAFKKNVPVAYAWEPVYIMASRKPVVSKRIVPLRDWIICPITMKKGLSGVKPEKVCHWAFEIAAARPDDDLIDLYPGTGAVSAAWKTWQGKFTLPTIQAAE